MSFFKVNQLIFNHSLLKTLLHLVLTASAYLIILFSHIRSLRIVRDNMFYQMPDYVYFANSLLHSFAFPRWLPWGGGVPIGLTLISFFNFLPYRLFGYLLYILLPFSPTEKYILTILLGMIITGIGWWLFLYKLTDSMYSATFGSLMIFWGGTGITIFHQEQILATMVWMPWIALTILQIRKNFNYILVLAILLGFSMTVHQPPIQLLSFIFLLLALILTGKIVWLVYIGKLKRGKWPILVLAILLFFLSASPIFYTIKTQKDFYSPVRGDQVKAITYEDYINIGQGFSSAPFVYFQSYIASLKVPDTIQPSTDPPSGDSIALFVTFIGLIFAALGIISRRNTAVPIVIVLLLSAWATLGFNAYLPQTLFIIKFPYIEFFREWYHFFPVVNFSLSALGALGCSALLQSKIKKQQILVIGIIVVSVMAIESEFHFSRYLNVIKRWSKSDISHQDKTQFLDSIKNRVDSPGYDDLLYVYKEYDKLYKESNRTINGNPFSASSVYNDVNLSFSKQDAMKKLFDSGLFPYAVTATIPLQQAKDINIPIHILSADLDFSFFKDKHSTGKHIFPRNDYTITPTEATLKGKALSSSLVVFPYSFKLGLEAFLNDRKVETYPVYNGGMTGIFVSKGDFDLKLVVPFSWYFLTLLMQFFLLLFIFFFIYYVSLKSLLLTDSGTKELL